MPHLRLAFLGFGNVGRALLRLWLDKSQVLRSQYDIEWSLTGIATRRHGSASDPEGIDPEKALALAAAGQSIHSLAHRPAPDDGVEFIHTCQADVLYENTPVNYQDGQPAVAHLEAALDRGMHAITANKGPVVHAYRQLTARAAAQRRRFLFEAAVMAGAPIFSLWRTALPGAHLISFRGILNATTNLILSRMESGSTFEDALAHAQAIGIAETDPSGDVLGWDAAVKVAALTTVLMDRPLIPSQVNRKGIEDLTPASIAEARRQGRRWKLVCRAERSEGGFTASVAPEMLAPEDPLHSVMGASSAVTFWTDVLGPLTVTETEPGTESTAFGLLADTVNAVRNV